MRDTPQRRRDTRETRSGSSETRPGAHETPPGAHETRRATRGASDPTGAHSTGRSGQARPDAPLRSATDADVQTARAAVTRGILRTVHVTAGGWRTLEHFWNARGTAFFRQPAGAEIKVRYGAGWFGFDTQEQTLDGSTYEKLEVGPGSLVRARMQMRVPRDTNVTYEVHGGGVAVDFPEQRF